MVAPESRLVVLHGGEGEMRRDILAFYNHFVKDSHGHLRAILKLVDARTRQSSTTTMAFSAVP